MGNYLSHIRLRIYPFNQNISAENKFTNILIEYNPSITNITTVSETLHDVTLDEMDLIKTNIIDKLPREIVEKIYKDYLEPEIFYIRYKEIIEHPTSMSLNGTYLVPYIPIILAKQTVCKYISKKCRQFKKSYIEHKITNKKSFHLMTNGQSFAATILFSLYH
jgi:hypothetical protein